MEAIMISGGKPDDHVHMLTNRWVTIDPWFGRPRRPLELDLGCGKGGFAIALAERHPERLVLAGDVMIGRLRRVVNKALQRGIDNFEVLRANSLDLVGYQLPDACADRVHVLCPDPWPKARHRCRRLVNGDFLVRVARVLVPGGVLHLATDDPAYLEFMLAAIRPLPFFVRDQDGATIADLGGLRTEFELNWLRQGKTVPHLAFVRQP